MQDIRSVLAGGSDGATALAGTVYPYFADRFPVKYYWFLTNGYNPHVFQTAFHTADRDGNLKRFRHLVAGRRGGKTLSAAWEVLFYCLNPSEFHRDAHGTNNERGLWVWVLTKDHIMGFAARMAFQEALHESGLKKDKDYRWNKTEKLVEFENGTILQFKTAEDPQTLRGAGLDILWVDEAAFISDAEAWDVVRPALQDKSGIVITTTTPKGKNWFHSTFWSQPALADTNQFRVEYTSIDNPFFPRENWEYEKAHTHPVLFKQEYLAAFDAMSGVELHGDWLHYYSIGEPERDDVKLPVKEGSFTGRKFIGVDPASSLSDRADFFAMALIGVAEDNSMAFLLDTYKDRIAFPDQLDKIREWFLKYRPEYIGIESNAYQRVLVQQAERMEGLPPIVPVISRGKKFERIMAMSPLFKIGKARIHKTHNDFIDEWVSYDSELSNPKDDLLDATEIALSAAGVLLPAMTPIAAPKMAATVDEEAWAQIIGKRDRDYSFDFELGAEA